MKHGTVCQDQTQEWLKFVKMQFLNARQQKHVHVSSICFQTELCLNVIRICFSQVLCRESAISKGLPWPILSLTITQKLD